MLNYVQGWRERGWRVIDAPAYADAWQRFGGSVATHPLVLAQLAEMADIPVRYLGWYQSDELKAAIPTWERYLALSKAAFARSMAVLMPISSRCAFIRLPTPQTSATSVLVASSRA